MDEFQQSLSQTSPKLTQLYANGFEVGMSLSDVGILLTIDGLPHTKISLSLITAKTIASQLSALIESYENATQQPVMLMGEVQQHLQQAELKAEPNNWQ